MKVNAISIMALLLASTGCNQSQPEKNTNGEVPALKPAVPSANPSPPPPSHPGPSNVVTPAPAPKHEGEPLSEPKGPIDPKGVEAAAQVVQHYGALIEQKRWGEATGLWGDAANAAKAKAHLSRFSTVHLEIGKPGDAEGAAGSIYVDVPVTFYGEGAGKDMREPATIILRRVNDVPGSTAAQRRWHIERIDWGS
jgi:hypothetical protein